MNYIILDTETANSFDDPLAYDISWIVINENGLILSERAYVNADIFIDEPTLMSEAFFSSKIPQYLDDIANGDKELKHFFNIRKALHFDYRLFDVKAIIAHNAQFDYKACQTTQRWLTKSKWRWFFPYGVEIWDTLKMARKVLGKDKDYRAFCAENGYTYGKGTPRLTAEILGRYLLKNLDFEESHTGIDDVKIEKEIFMACKNFVTENDCKLWE